MKVFLSALAAALALAPAAYAHTNYMKPSAFTTSGDVVAVESSFAEQFFIPEFPVDSSDYHVVRPNGARDTLDIVQNFRLLTLLETDLTEPGTYRITSGVRLGRISTQARINGQWQALEPGATPPAGAEARRSQTETVADVYVSKGAPTRPAVDVRIGRLALHPITHPSEIYLDSGFTLEVLFDGAPLANQSVVLGRASYGEPIAERTLTTDAQGRITLAFDAAGAYVLMTRHAASAPAGAQTATRSYTSSLTFEVSS
jgi:uncharacterized GH25 family protein